MKLIKVEHAYKIYKNGTTAVADLSVSIDKGEFVFVIGSTGSGKSTFIKMLYREENLPRVVSLSVELMWHDFVILKYTN